MTFDVYTDVTSNLPADLLDGISLIPSAYTIEDTTVTYNGDLEHFAVQDFYDQLRNGALAKTSLVNSYTFKQYFMASIEKGRDLIYIAMSSGISGTFNAASLAAEELMQEYPDRSVFVVDSKGCGFGTGRLAIKAVHLAKEGTPVHDAYATICDQVEHACQYFTVNDLMFLRRTGRVHGVAAQLGTMLKINPILYGNSEGFIVVSKKMRGRSKAVSALVEIFKAKRLPEQDVPVCISHGDCLEDARLLQSKIREIIPDTEVVVAPHEPISGSHVGPGMLAVFFDGDCR